MKHVRKVDLEQLKNTKPLVMLVISATWCGPCKRMHTDMDKMVENWEKIKEPLSDKMLFLTADEAESEDLVKEYNVRAYPTIIFFYNGKRLANSIVTPQDKDLYDSSYAIPGGWVGNYGPKITEMLIKRAASQLKM
jgi:thioredoxin 1